MDFSHEDLSEKIRKMNARIKNLYFAAYELYSCAVDEILTGKITDGNLIEQITDGLIDNGDIPGFTDLYTKLYRHIHTD